MTTFEPKCVLMKISVVAATEPELELLRCMSLPPAHEYDFMAHGAGLMEAGFRLQVLSNQAPDLIIQCGIAGSYYEPLRIGDTVMVQNEFTDTGAEDQNELLSIFDLGFKDKDEFPFKNGALPCPYLRPEFDLPVVDGLTVNCATGSLETLIKRKNRFPGVAIESMEGAALHYICLMTKIPFLQIRTISNKVEPRNREHWNIELALKSNAIAVHSLLKKINVF